VQEALTNVRKHAVEARTVQIVIRHVPGAVEIEVRDDGHPRASRGGPAPHVGFGLVGLRERVALYAGEFRAGPEVNGGFCVSARLPLVEAGH
jgi:signal transduction histidine kinase